MHCLELIQTKWYSPLLFCIQGWIFKLITYNEMMNNEEKRSIIYLPGYENEFLCISFSSYLQYIFGCVPDIHEVALLGLVEIILPTYVWIHNFRLKLRNWDMLINKTLKHLVSFYGSLLLRDFPVRTIWKSCQISLHVLQVTTHIINATKNHCDCPYIYPQKILS